MITEEQKSRLIELLEEFADDHAHNYYMEDRGCGSEVDRAKEQVDKSKEALYNYIGKLCITNH